MAKVKSWRVRKDERILQKRVERAYKAGEDAGKEFVDGLKWNVIDSIAEDEKYRDYDGNLLGSVFLGTVFSIMPSGKYYTPWANSNVDEFEAAEDEAFWDVLSDAADEHGYCVENGEGDPCDIFLTKVFPQDEDFGQMNMFDISELRELSEVCYG